MNGTIQSITDAIAAVEAARVDWARNSKIFAALGPALDKLRSTRDRACKEVRAAYVADVQGKPQA